MSPPVMLSIKNFMGSTDVKMLILLDWFDFVWQEKRMIRPIIKKNIKNLKVELILVVFITPSSFDEIILNLFYYYSFIIISYLNY